MIKFITLLFLLLSLVHCEAPKDEEPPSSEPKTTYGQSVHKARELDTQHDQRNEELQKQADQLFDD